jgi:hypothetical protein
LQIRKIGPQPEDNFFIMPNAAIRDKRLSYRARGLMAVISSHDTGFHVSSDELAEGGLEGIKAIRTAMNELVAAGYMRRVRSQDAGGKWRTDIDVYIWGDAPPLVTKTEAIIVDDDITDEPFPPVGSPPTQNRRPVMVHVGEDHLENSSTPVVAASPTSATPALQVPVQGPGSSGVSQRCDTLPVVLRRKLQDMGVTEGTVWETAWSSAMSLEWPEFAAAEQQRFPEEHLMLHLMAQQEQGRAPTASRWMRFYIEDRQRRITIIAGQIESLARAAETPQEREDRQNKALPPVWEPAAATGESES